jgi:hypothetical protein
MGIMTAEPRELNLALTPRSRYDAIDVAAQVREEFGDVLAGFRRVLYCSLHTTAGYLEQSLSSRLDNRRARLDPFMQAFQRLFPPVLTTAMTGSTCATSFRRLSAGASPGTPTLTSHSSAPACAAA